MDETNSQIALVTDGDLRIELSGTIDVFLARELLDAAKRAVLVAGDVTLDCAKLERLDTSALQVLLAMQRRFGEQGRGVRLRGTSASVRAFFGFSGAGGLLIDPEQHVEVEPPRAPELAGADAARFESDGDVDSGWQSIAPATEDAAHSDSVLVSDSGPGSPTTELCNGGDE